MILRLVLCMLTTTLVVYRNISPEEAYAKALAEAEAANSGSGSSTGTGGNTGGTGTNPSNP